MRGTRRARSLAGAGMALLVAALVSVCLLGWSGVAAASANAVETPVGSTTPEPEISSTVTTTPEPSEHRAD